MEYKGKRMDVEAVKDEIITSTETSSVYIGADSKTFLDGEDRYCAYCVTVILHRDSKHGASLYHDITIERDFGDVKKPRARLMSEVYKVVGIANELIESIGDRHYEIHIDVNPSEKFKSNTALSEANGLILGTFGVKPKCKPEAFAASAAADRFAVKTAKNAKHRPKRSKKSRKC